MGTIGIDGRPVSDGCGEWMGSPPSPVDLTAHDGPLAPVVTAGGWQTGCDTGRVTSEAYDAIRGE